MTTLKGLAILALLVGGTSLVVAQNGLPTGNQAPVAGGARGGPGVSTRTHVARHPTSRNGSLYMQGNLHHGTKHTGTALSHQKFMNNQNSYR
jgi:hypothetical protein